VVKASVSG
ncbi:hypothetical protein D046_0312B, partial [Vibrio parahaemolyticus V-223/04]